MSKLTEKEIQYLLWNFYNKLGHKLVVPNIYLHYSEADLITVQASGYVNEIEIKRTKVDFKNDFKKRKHTYMAEAATTRLHLPNYFWFAYPATIHESIDFEIPDYYGMIQIKFEKYPVIEKRARLLHKKKITDKQVRQIARSLMFKMWNTRWLFDGLNDWGRVFTYDHTWDFIQHKEKTYRV